MGFDVQRFMDKVDDEFICGICSGVFENPIQIAQCEHIFCATCLSKWLIGNQTCPIDRSEITHCDIQKVPRIVRNLLMHLTIKCENIEAGCTGAIHLEDLNKHRLECIFNVEKPIYCSWGCGALLNKTELQEHDCADEMLVTRGKNEVLVKKIELGILRQKIKILELKKIFRMLQNSLLQRSEQLLFANFEFQRSELINWARTLPKARISHWISLLFTSDPILKSTTRSALEDAGCPSFVNVLAENTCEENWPCAFESSNKRRTHRSAYRELFFRRIPNKQIILLFPFDNEMSSSYFAVDPGHVMNFVCGVEDDNEHEIIAPEELESQ